MKAKEAVRLASLRAIKAAIMLAKTAEGATGEVSDQEVVKIIQKLVKQRKESAQQYTAAGRPELAENELAEAAEMEVYLPKQLSEAEVEAELVKIQTEYNRILSEGILESVLKEGAEKANRTAEKTLRKVQKKIGVEIF